MLALSTFLLGALQSTAAPPGLYAAAATGDLPELQRLIEAGAAIDEPIDDGTGVTPLHAAAWGDHADATAVLLGSGASVDPTLEGGFTPLHLAAAADAASAASVLCAAGALQECDDEGQSPLHAAASAGALATCGVLLSAGADVDSPDAFGFSPLRWACLNGHARAVDALLDAGADGTTPIAGLTPLALAAAAGHLDVVRALQQAGVRDGDPSGEHVSALEVASEMGHGEVAEALRLVGAAASSRSSADEVPPVPASSSPRMASSAFSRPAVREIDAGELEADSSLWTHAFTSSTPLLIRGLGKKWADDISSQSAEQLQRRWGDRQVTVAFSPDELYQRPEVTPAAEEEEIHGGPISSSPAAVSGRPHLRQVPTQRMAFSQFVDLLPSHGVDEYFAVSQSASESLDEFGGLPRVPPLLDSLIRGETDAESGSEDGCNRRNLWVCLAPKVSACHYDSDDSVLVQLSGTKRFTLISPEPLHGLTAYPASLPARRLERLRPGVFARREEAFEARGPQDEQQDEAEEQGGSAVLHFQLVNASSPDLRAHPLFRYAEVLTVDVRAGDALLLPAYWFHQVSSTSEPDRLNVAINYWFDFGGAARGSVSDGGSGGNGAAVVPPSRLHRILRAKLRRLHDS